MLKIPCAWKISVAIVAITLSLLALVFSGVWNTAAGLYSFVQIVGVDIQQNIDEQGLDEPVYDVTLSDAEDGQVEGGNEQAPAPEHGLSNEQRLENIMNLMITRVSQLTLLEKHLIVEQIIAELPSLVSTGQFHPYDATYAYIKAMSHKNIKLDQQQVDSIKAEYVSLYPMDISYIKDVLH